MIMLQNITSIETGARLPRKYSRYLVCPGRSPCVCVCVCVCRVAMITIPNGTLAFSLL